MPGRPRASGALANLALVLAGIVVACALLEIALRALRVETAAHHAIGGFTLYDPVLGWRLAPARARVFQGAHFAVRIAHNAEGLRDRHYPYEREPGRRRILVLGDSFVWCWGVEQSECFTELLEAALGGTDVINAGVPGWSTAQEMLWYEREGRRYRPDLVLLVFTPNDPADNVSDQRGPRFRLGGDRLVAPVGLAPRRKGPVREWLTAHSKLFAELGYMAAVAREALEHAGAGERGGHVERDPGAPAPGQAHVPAAPPPASKAWRLTDALLDRLAADVKADGARFAIVNEELPRPMGPWLRRSAPRGASPACRSARGSRPPARAASGCASRGPAPRAGGQMAVAHELLAFLQRSAAPDAGSR
jgi:hypothetical protein